MMGHKVCFYREIRLIIPKLSQLPLLNWSTHRHPKPKHTNCMQLMKNSGLRYFVKRAPGLLAQQAGT